MIDGKNLEHRADYKEQADEKKQEGASMVEYALLLLLIAVVALAAIRTLGSTVNNTFSTINSSLLVNN